MRSITIPSQSRSSLAILRKTQGVDIVERFRELAPTRDRISLQRWTWRRIGLTAGAIFAIAMLVGWTIDNFRAGVL
jgi:hypothetical protein